MTIPSHIRECVKDHLAQFVSSDPDALLFTAAMGGCHLNDRVFNKDVFKKAAKDIGLFPYRQRVCTATGTATFRTGAQCICPRPPVSMK